MIVSVVELPFRSVAVTAMMLTPPASGMPGAVQFVVPIAAPLPPRLLTQVTDAMPVSSAAVPASDTLAASEAKVGSAVGEVIVMTGGVPVALVTLTVSTFWCDTRAVPPTTMLPPSDCTVWPSPLKLRVSSSVLPSSVSVLDAVEVMVSLPAPASTRRAVSAARPGPTVTRSSPPRALANTVSVVPMSIVMAPGWRKKVTRWPLAVTFIVSTPLPPLNWNVSLPSSPLTGSLPSPGFQIIKSSPGPPLCGSTPGPPVSVSLPAPPFSVSLPGRR